MVNPKKELLINPEKFVKIEQGVHPWGRLYTEIS